MKDFLKKMLGTIAPIAGTAIGGPFGGVVAKMAAEKLGVDTSGQTTEQIENQVADRIEKDPEAMLKLRTLDVDLQKFLAENNIRRDELVYKDTADARQREIQTKDTTNRKLAYTMTGMLAGVITALFVMAFRNVEVGETIMSTLTLLLGVLIADHKQIIAYYFGSSRGSAEKTELLSRNG